jgi:WD40 repeat protein/tRNA A-37 threonylcarbamoyl transferase component Bud32
MPEPQTERVEELFHLAADLDADQRRQFLATQCGGDTRLLAAVESLLQYDDGGAKTAEYLLSPVAQAVAAQSLQPTLTVPGYEILGTLGAGGMGVVYKARQLSLNRLVALKMLSSGTAATAEDLSRFRIEAEALAQLQHPNIVQVFDQGKHEGRPYFAMEYVNGPSLAAILEKGPQDPGASAHMIETLARTMQTVHQHGLVHRDLKPANILLVRGDGSDAVHHSPLATHEPKVTDFGIAKLLEAKRSQTVSGSILGTPMYMAPEQAEGGKTGVGPAADIYALGTILYEMLTGRPPFLGVTVLETLLEVRTREPLAPRQIRPKLPRDLQTICLKCLQKDPSRRYASALALAEDLARFQAGRPILARPVGPLGRVYRWCRRRPLVAGLLAGMVLLAVTLIVSVVSYHLRLRAALGQSTKTADDRRKLLVQVNVSSGMNELDDRYSFTALLWFMQALRLDDADRERNHRTRIGVALRQFPRLVQVLGNGEALSCARLSPDGRRVFTGWENGVAQLWDIATGTAGPELQHEGPVRLAAFGPQTHLLATVTGSGTTRIWDMITGKAQTPPWSEGAVVDDIAFGQADAVLLTRLNDHRIQFRGTATGEPIPCPALAEKAPAFSTLSGDGRWVLTVDHSHVAQLWEVTTRKPALEPLRLGRAVDQAAISPDGKRLAVVVADGTARIWSAVLGKQVGEPMRHAARITYLTFAPAGDRVVTVGDLSAKVWKADTAELLISGLRHDGVVNKAEFSEDGLLLATCGSDNRARVWNARSGETLTPPLAHNGSIFLAAFTPDKSRVITAGADNMVRVWELPGPVKTVSGEGVRSQESEVSVLSPAPTEARSPDGRFRVGFGAGPSIQITDVGTGTPVGPALQHSSRVTFAAFSPDAHRVITASDDNTARIWDVQTGELLVSPLHHRSTVRWAAFSPDGNRLITASDDHAAQVWDASTGERLTAPLKHPCEVRKAWFSADMEAMTLGADQLVRTWDLRPDNRPLELLLREAEVLSGHRLDQKRGLVPLDGAELWAAWQRLRSEQ